jgi:hypothetical protein
MAMTEQAGGAVPDPSDPFVIEASRIRARRAAVLADETQGRPWALALSGGGIRSATFAFGVLQALATVDTQSEAPVTSRGPKQSLLRRFDYLSTVSGGGYIGAFFCSLFVPGRLQAGSSSQKAADQAYETLATVPPHRLRTDDVLDPSDIGHCPTAWLRENGRYLTPTGAGDYLYVAATGVRNWFALQYVLATLFLVVFALLGLTRGLFAHLVSACTSHAEIPAFGKAMCGAYTRVSEGQDSLAQFGIVWSPVWWLVLGTLALWVAPSSVAFWLAYPGKRQSDDAPAKPFGRAARFTALAGLIFGLGAWLIFGIPQLDSLTYVLRVGVLTIVLALVFHLFCAAGPGSTISGYRVRVTRVTTKGIAWFLALSVIAVAETAGLGLYQQGTTLHQFSLPAMAAAIVWVVRKLAAVFDGTKAPTSALRRIPLGAITAVAAIVLLILLASTWDLIVQMLTWKGQATATQLGSAPHLLAMGAVLVISVGLALSTGRFPGFINLSTLLSFYSARLTRAYLGASNGERFSADSVARSAAEPLASDQLDLETYYAKESFAPIHLINVTVNQTVDPTEQLIQRDRKGRPLALTPTGFFIDGKFYPRVAGITPKEDGKANVAQGAESLSLGQWIGTSGAALTTGLGRLTSFGTSLGLGLANVRLGVWWSSGEGRDDSRYLERIFKRIFPTQSYLLYELSARFYGLHRRLQYLSDGGHFENTGIYELLRKARQIKLIVACDNGCDAAYEFGDLANLVRLARIDFGLDILVDETVLGQAALPAVFGKLEDFEASAAPSNKCAILLNVYDSKECAQSRVPVCRIVLLKPRVVRAASIDITNYQRDHVAFPQESTANQFFDEAQWESYRDLGYRIGQLVFGCSSQGGAGAALWAYLDGAP